MTDLTKTDKDKSLLSLLKNEWHLAPRVMIASIPVVGHGISVLIEDQIVRRQHEKIVDFAHQLSKKLEKTETALDKISDELFLFASKKAAEQPEKWKPRTIANMLAIEKADNELLFKHLLIDHTSQLTDFDLAIFLDIAGANDTQFPSELRYAILDLQSTHPEVKLLKDISERKLVQLGFLRRESDEGAHSFGVTDIGSALIDAI